MTKDSGGSSFALKIGKKQQKPQKCSLGFFPFLPERQAKVPEDPGGGKLPSFKEGLASQTWPGHAPVVPHGTVPSPKELQLHQSLGFADKPGSFYTRPSPAPGPLHMFLWPGKSFPHLPMLHIWIYLVLRSQCKFSQ